MIEFMYNHILIAFVIIDVEARLVTKGGQILISSR
jgi:hypothetical protein